MKKIICLCLAILMVASALLCSCGGKESEKEQGSTADKTEKAKIEVKKNENTSDILGVTNRQELADRLACSLEELDQFVIYASRLNDILPDGAEAKTDFVRGTTDDDVTWVSREEARTFVEATLVTTDNWYEYLVAYMRTSEYYWCGDDGNESVETDTSPCVDVKEGYTYDWTDFYVALQEVSTGATYTFEDGYWSGSISEYKGKYYVGVPNDDGWYDDIEFTPDNFICTKADGVVYKLNVPEELLIVNDDEGNYLNYAEHKDEYSLNDAMLPVVDNPDNPQETICFVGYSGIGYYVMER